MFGDTRLIADDVADGLRRSAACSVVEVRDAPTVVDHDVDLLVVGAPSHAFGLSTRETRREAQQQFQVFADRWQSRYPAAVKLWRSAWTEFIPFLDYTTRPSGASSVPPTPSRV